MAIDYSNLGVYRNIKPDDIKRMAENKVNYENATNDAAKSVYNMNNANIRSAYGISEDQDVPLSTLNEYIAIMEKENTTNSLLRNLNNSYVPGANVRAAADKVQNFKYDPESDPAYKSYVDMYNRQGQSAAKNTLNQLNSSSMGRNSSYSSAATAQVQAAYNAKAAEMIPTLAQQAYDRLLQGYNIEKDYDDTTYNRLSQNYQLNRQSQSQDITDENSRKQGTGLDIQNKKGEIELEYLPKQLQIKIENGNLTNEYQKLLNEGYSIQNAINQIALQIQQRFGIPMAEAEYAAMLISNTGGELNNKLTQVQIDNARQVSGGSSSSGGYSGGSTYASYGITDDTYDTQGNEQEMGITNQVTFKGNGDIDSIFVRGYGRLTPDEVNSLMEKGLIKQSSTGALVQVR